MLVEVLSHDVDTAIARIKFTHNDVVVENEYNLLLVEPSMKRTLELTNGTFTADLQQNVIDMLTSWVQRSIERGGLQNIDK
jgi:hypothetical protein